MFPNCLYTYYESLRKYAWKYEKKLKRCRFKSYRRDERYVNIITNSEDKAQLIIIPLWCNNIKREREREGERERERI